MSQELHKTRRTALGVIRDVSLEGLTGFGSEYVPRSDYEYDQELKRLKMIKENIVLAQQSLFDAYRSDYCHDGIMSNDSITKRLQRSKEERVSALFIYICLLNRNLIYVCAVFNCRRSSTVLPTCIN